MSKLRDWPANLLRSVNIETPDGRPLYAYRCANESFDELCGLLTGWNPRDSVGGRAFAVYAAEWWRRHFDGGPWAWQPLLDSIRCDAWFPELYRPLRNAWRWWGVKPVVLGASVRYLGTCACQGGLPLHLVSSPNSNVRQFLRALLREYRTFRTVVDDGYLLAEPLRSYLPRSLRQEPVYRLCADIMEQIWDLREDIGSDEEDPLVALDGHRPGWQERLPIDIGDEQARGLIVSLLRGAVEPTHAGTEQFQVLRYIADTSSSPRFVVEPRVPRQVPAAALAKRVGVRELPSRFQLRVDGPAPIPIANGRVTGDHVVFSSPLAEPEHLAALADKEIRWFIQSGRRIGDSFAPRGSAAPGDDLPWVFAALEDQGARFDLYSEGSVRTRLPRVAIACRAEAAETLRGHPDCREWRVQPVAGRMMFDVEGDVRLDTSVGTCRIRTAQEQEQQYEHRLDGAPCLDVDAPLPVYRRKPAVFCVEPDGKQRAVSTAQISWRAVRGDEWMGSPDLPGVWRVRRVVEGETVFLSKICWAGADFGVRIVPGRDPTRGFVDIKGTLVDVACEQPQVDVHTERNADGLRVTVSFVRERAAEANGRRDPPSHVVLATRWPNGSILPLTVPFPGRGARFAHPVYAEVDRRRGLSVQSLYGWRALAVSPRSPRTFRLVGELRADDLDERMRGAACFDVALPEVGDGVSELPLIEVHDALESLFATTKLLDAQIDLELTSGGFMEAKTVVRRFACDVVASDAGVYRVPTRRGPDRETPVSFEAFSLEKPGLGRAPLERADEVVEPSGWRLARTAFPQDTKVVFARRGDQHFARPFVDPSARPALAPVQARSLADAASIPEMEDRIAAMRQVLEQMVEEGSDENWEYLWDLLDVSRGLPATTFDALDCLSDSPGALVQFVLRTPDEVRRARIWRLDHELPFSWLLVPLAVWREEMVRTHQAITTELEQIGILAPDEVRRRAAGRVRDVAVEAARTCPAWGRRVNEAGVGQVTLLEHLAADAIFGCEVAPERALQPPARGAFDGLFRTDPYQALLQQGSDFRWPSGPDRDDWAASVDLLNETAWREAIWADCGGVGFRRPLSDAPFGAAFAAACGVRVSRPLVHATKLLRSHAPEWFDTAYASALAWILGVDGDSQNHD